MANGLMVHQLFHGREGKSWCGMLRTCVDTLAPSHRVLAAREAGAVADDAEHRKRVKYTHLESTHYFIPVAIQTLGAMGQEARSLTLGAHAQRGLQ